MPGAPHRPLSAPATMPGIYGFDHMVVRVEDFNVGMGDMGMLPGLELREVGANA